MRKTKLIARASFAFVLAFLLSPQPLLAAEAKTGSKPTGAAQDELFSEPKVLQLKIEIPAAGLEALKKDPRSYVKGTLREGDNVYAQAGIRLKGNTRLQDQQTKPSLAVKFNEFNSGLHFHGQSKIILDNAHQDPTFLSQAIGSEIFRA